MTNNNSKIAKNTFMLYIRMFMTMIVSIFTARIVFNTLGVENYGIYNVVAGVIVLFSFLNAAMGAASQRFIAYEIGKGNNENSVNHVFNISMQTHFIIAILVAILAETIGLWFVNTELNIPPNRMYAANIVYQLSIISMIISILQIPYYATIIAYEKMSVYAYFSIFDVLFKLAIIFLVQIIRGDKLIVYGFLILSVSLLNFLIYNLYCRKTFKSCRLRLVKDMPLLKKLFNFSGWSLFGQAAVVTSNQGINILINIFFNAAANAAMGIAMQVCNIMNNFVTNFQMAFNPQIIKSYAAEEKTYVKQLTFQASKISFYLLMIIAIPVMLELKDLLTIWLGAYPEYTLIFCRLTIVYMIIEALSAPFWMLVNASGKIRKYQIFISSAYFLNIILSYLFLKQGFDAPTVVIIRIIVTCLLFTIRLFFAAQYGQFKIKDYLKNIILKIVLVFLITFSISYIAHEQITNTNEWFRVLITALISCPVSLITIYFVGLNYQEKQFINQKIAHLYSKIK